MDVVTLRAFEDNCICLAHESGRAVVVDPGDQQPVQAALRAQRLKLAAVFLTHHHGDHTDGCEVLAAEYGCPVFGPDDPRLPAVTRTLSDGQTAQADGFEARALATPGHTRTHLSYHFEPQGLLCCGDALFHSGCGRMFEGDPDTFWRSLLRLRGLPPATRVFCGHDYAVENLRFALDVEPGHAEAAAALDEALAVRRAGLASVPFDLGSQRRLNPFLRCDEPALAAALHVPRATPSAVFAALRLRKDGF